MSSYPTDEIAGQVSRINFFDLLQRFLVLAFSTPLLTPGCILPMTEIALLVWDGSRLDELSQHLLRCCYQSARTRRDAPHGSNG